MPNERQPYLMSSLVCPGTKTFRLLKMFTTSKPDGMLLYHSPGNSMSCLPPNSSPGSLGSFHGRIPSFSKSLLLATRSMLNCTTSPSAGFGAPDSRSNCGVIIVMGGTPAASRHFFSSLDSDIFTYLLALTTGSWNHRTPGTSVPGASCPIFFGSGEQSSLGTRSGSVTSNFHTWRTETPTGKEC